MNKNEKQEYLNKIHALALDDDHRNINFKNAGDIVEMQSQIVNNLEKKLLRIADMLQVLAGD